MVFPLVSFLFGLFLGSFLGVLIERIPKGKDIFLDRSRCDFCHKKLEASDLLPLLSFFFLKGKCRYCKKQLSIFYPSIELVTGVIFFFVAWQMANTSIVFVSILYSFFISAVMIVIFFTDYKYGIIPDKVVYPSYFVVLIYNLFFYNVDSIVYVLSGLGAGGFFLFLFLVTKGRGMGFGDVKFAVLMGLLLGFPLVVYGVYLAFLTGAAVSLILILWRKKSIKNTIPFGPFLAVVTFLVFLFPDKIENLFRLVLPL